MPKQKWKPGNMLYPLPAVLVSCGDKSGKINVMTAAWTGTICSDPAMVYVSIRKSRYSHHMICETGEYCINLTTEALARAADFAGVRSGRDMDKFKELHLTPVFGTLKYAPMIDESPVCIECRVEKILELGSHDMFMARVEAVYADEKYMDEKGRFDLEKAKPLVYSHGQYYGTGKRLGKFGYAVQKKKPAKKQPAKKH
ncbi:MAG TPA: flavin reductase family protein [Candidatus Scybalocola faecigallinarum]|uniref:Flavin reductase family protein n=1 Tax=Candidatus Scybalocola faecigallinarum TaxID=2840941 RepID=A0A9D1F2I7_9FIRM|nr:flavin reductase family protein [Candidatus Scybalocola faecigallinarum]